MSLRKRIAVSAACFVVFLVVGGGIWFYRSLSHVPLFYSKALTRSEAELRQSNHEMLQQTANLSNDLKRPGQWQAVFTDQQINGWLAIDVPKNHPELLPPEVRHPRVQIAPEQVLVGARFEGTVSAIVSLEFDLSLTTTNVVAVRLHKARVGDVPWRMDQIVNEATRAANQWGFQIEQAHTEGDPVLLVTLPPDTENRRKILLDRLELREGEIFLSGRTAPTGGR